MVGYLAPPSKQQQYLASECSREMDPCWKSRTSQTEAVNWHLILDKIFYSEIKKYNLSEWCLSKGMYLPFKTKKPMI